MSALHVYENEGHGFAYEFVGIEGEGWAGSHGEPRYLFTMGGAGGRDAQRLRALTVAGLLAEDWTTTVEFHSYETWEAEQVAEQQKTSLGEALDRAVTVAAALVAESPTEEEERTEEAYQEFWPEVYAYQDMTADLYRVGLAAYRDGGETAAVAAWDRMTEPPMFAPMTEPEGVPVRAEAGSLAARVLGIEPKQVTPPAPLPRQADILEEDCADEDEPRHLGHRKGDEARCHDCGRRMFYVEADGWYRHVETPEEGCFLIVAECGNIGISGMVCTLPKDHEAECIDERVKAR